jgi:hypothetical protein
MTKWVLGNNEHGELFEYHQRPSPRVGTSATDRKCGADGRGVQQAIQAPFRDPDFPNHFLTGRALKRGVLP